MDLYRDRFDMAMIKLVTALISGVLLYLFLNLKKMRTFAAVLIVWSEIEISLIVFKNQFDNFSTTYPLLILFGFFFFFKIRNALLMTGGHFVYWIALFAYGAILYPDHSILHNQTALNGMVITSLFFVLFGVFYYYSTEVSYQELKSSNTQNEILLKEIHHRIKNNLNMIASIIGLQIISSNGKIQKSHKEVLTDSKLRIEAMAMVHESLYKNQDIDKVSFQKYVINLTDLIKKTYGEKVSIHIKCNNLTLPLESMFRLGIIINELFTNSIKYAFTPDHVGDQVHICLLEDEENYIFKYHENKNDHIDIQKILDSKTLGIRLIKLTIKQMTGNLNVSKNNGLIFTITFPKVV
jgi:two-component sensor histidine kinase